MKTAEKILSLKVNSSKLKKKVSFDYDPTIDEKIWEKNKKDLKKARAEVYAETYGK